MAGTLTICELFIERGWGKAKLAIGLSEWLGLLPVKPNPQCQDERGSNPY